MSLMHLLKVSKSFSTVKNQTGVYRVAQSRVLPKFARVGRPISLAPPNQPMLLPEIAQAQNQISPIPNQTTQNLVPVASDFPERQRKGLLKKPLFGRTPPPFDTPDPEKRKRRFWLFRKAASKAQRAWIQGELSLDSVKVVCNDLKDADLEVVPALKPSPAHKAVSRKLTSAPKPATLFLRWSSRLAAIARSWL